MKKGFTLVELSIVLVIIGLLIGGILIGQSLVSSSQVSAFVSQVQQFDAAVGASQSKFKGLPGDARAHGGNGDGIITSCCGYNVNRFMGEVARFWATAMPDKYTRCASQCQTFTSGANINVPLSKLGSKGSYFIASAYTTDGSSAYTTTPANYYAVIDASQVQTQITSEWIFSTTNPSNADSKPNVFTPAELAAVDNKMDDGAANAGYVRSGRMHGGAAAGVSVLSLAACSTAARYLIDTTDYTCTPVIRIGSQAGQAL